MRIDILTLFPEMLEPLFNYSIVKRAKDKNIVEIFNHNIRDYTLYKHNQVDDYQYGGGSGMVMMIEPIARCLDMLKNERNYDEIIYMSPDGETLNQSICNHYSTYNNLILLCGHYKGIDERIRGHLITKEISIGNYVISGGELAAAVFTDSIIRLIPGVLNDATSALSDSYQNFMIAPPVFTRPYEFNGWKVPDVLLSGNEKEIFNWRMTKAIEKTLKQRHEFMDDDINEYNI